MFTKEILDNLLDDIIDEYFSEDTQRDNIGLWEVVENVKLKYEAEIESLRKNTVERHYNSMFKGW